MEKSLELKMWLERTFPASVVEYQFADELHKFRINTAKSTYWLYISQEYVDDHAVWDIIKAADRAQVLDVFRNSDKPRWVFLGEGIVKEVDEHFPRQG